MALLELDHLDKTFDRGAVHAVRDFSLAVDQGEFVVLVGSSGCGKSTVLRLIAGLEPPSSGRVLLNGRDVGHLRPVDRNVAMVFQDYALYPHLTVFDNIAFPLKARKMPKAERARKVRAVSAMLDIEDILDRPTAKLSGGQQQRVAIGRALVRDPALFLMDEPLSNLDAKLRAHMRGELASIHRTTGATMLYVTHDQTEAMTLATKIVVMDGGVIQQIGTPTELYLEPRTAFVAGFIGSPPMNFVPCRMVRGRVRFGRFTLALPSRHAGLRGRYEGRDLLLGARPEHLALVDCEDGTRTVDDMLAMAGRYLHGEIVGSDAFLSIDIDGTVIVAKTDVRSMGNLHPGAHVGVRLHFDDTFLFDARTGENILLNADALPGFGAGYSAR